MHDRKHRASPEDETLWYHNCFFNEDVILAWHQVDAE